MTTQDREQRIRALLPLVKQLARRVHRMLPSADIDDVIGDGSLGLIRAVDAFDPSHGVPLEQYARKVVLGAMLNGVRRLDPVSERARRTLRVAETLRYALAQELGALPAVRDLEDRVPGLARAQVDAHRATPLSLDVTLPSGERLEPNRSTDPQAVLSLHDERERVRVAIAALPERQRRVVIAHYLEEQSLRSLHRSMGISPQRVSQLHLIAMRRLRASLAESA